MSGEAHAKEKEKEVALDVKSVLRRLDHLGLEIRPGGNHWKVYHPQSGAWLFDVSKSPSDYNWHYNIVRHMKRVGLDFHATPKGKRGFRGKNRHTAVDLVALKLAQDKAAAAGERIPQLADLDDAPPTSPLWKRDSHGAFVKDAEQEVITNMAIRAEAARVSYVRGRLRNFMSEKGDALAEAARKRFPSTRPGSGANSEFARIAIYEVAPARNMRTWKNFESAQQSVGAFLKHDDSGLSVWALNLIDATIDHINGLKWGYYELESGEKVEPVQEPVVEPEPEQAGISLGPVPEPEPVPVTDLTDQLERQREQEREPALNGLKERYADVLLTMLAEGSYRDENEFLQIMQRLDKIILGE
jgi:hypothetical protein